MNLDTLSRRLRKTHRNLGSWGKAGAEFGISGGLAYLIANKHYDPAGEQIRKRLGLNTRKCPTCHRSIIKKRANKQSKPNYMIKWLHLPTDERNRVIQEYIVWREVYGRE